MEYTVNDEKSKIILKITALYAIMKNTKQSEIEQPLFVYACCGVMERALHSLYTTAGPRGARPQWRGMRKGMGYDMGAISTILICLALCACVTLAIVYLYKNRGRGCNGNCASCGTHCAHRKGRK